MVPAFGVLGGASGLPVASWVEGAGGAIHDFDTPGKVGGHVLHEGDRVVLRSAGGGGYGDPLERPAGRVAEDVALGFVSAEAAERLYGVVLAAGGGVDVEVTTRRRAEIRARRVHLEAVAGEDCYRAGPVSRRRICRLNPADAARARIGDGDLMELDTRRAAPLRAWAEIDAAAAPGTLPIDARGLGMLRAKLSEPIEIRLLRRAGSGPRDAQGI
jgi:N-methylhydantoinase B